MSEKKLKAWQQAGLIDQAAVERIRAWEGRNSRPIGLWAMIGLAVLTMGLGIVSLVAANWDALPGTMRLGLHLALLVGLSAALFWYLPRPAAKTHMGEAGLFLVAVLGLTFFAHIGQVYQTSAPLWQPLLAWLLLFSPLLLLFGQGTAVAFLWMAGVLGTGWAHVDAHGYGEKAAFAQPALYWGLIVCPLMLIIAGAAWARGYSARLPFWRLIEKLAFGTVLAGFTLFILVAGFDTDAKIPLLSVAIHSLALFGAATAVAAARSGRSGRATASILIAIGALHLVQALLFQWVSPWRGAWTSSLFFLLLWGGVGAAAIYAGWRRAFQTAIALIAFRIILLSFELGDDLLGSGAGLILAGLLALGAVWVTIRISRRFAPARGADA